MRVKGTIIKAVISIDLPSGLTMDDIDFSCRFFVYYGSNASQKIKKSEMIRVNENSYTCYIDTKIIGTGEIWLETTAYLPDSDYESGTRVEIDKINTGIKTV